jgi:hypothetical protein
MRVAIIGSRSITEVPWEKLRAKIPEDCTEIVSGGAEGIDQAAREVAKELGVPITEFYPDYESYGKSAPVKRNEQIAQYCDMMIAVWDYRSRGTKDALSRALKAEKLIQVIVVETKEEKGI